MKALTYLFLAVNILLVQAKVTFKVIAVSGTPKVVVNGKKYDMTVEEYPVYKASVDVKTPVKYHYILNGSEEKFEREANGDTLNEFFDRKITVKKHPLLPLAYQVSPLQDKSKLYDDTFIATILVEAPQSQIDNLHNNPKDEKLKYEGIKVIYVSPYNVQTFNKAKISISGQSTTEAKKLSYKLGGLKTDDGKDLFDRTSIKLRANHMDPSLVREKIYIDMLNSLGIPTPQGKFARLFINKKPIGIFFISDDLNNGHFLKNTFNAGKKFTVNNHIFKADAYPDANIYANMKYYGKSSSKYGVYTYKGDEDTKTVSSTKMVEEILVPLFSSIKDYAQTKKINLDVHGFLKAMAMQYAAYANDNYWMNPGNYFLFKNVVENYWYFLDNDFHISFGLGGSPSKAIKAKLDEYINLSEVDKERPLLDIARKVADNDAYLKNVLKRMVKTIFNINAVGPRIDSLVELIRDDVYWDSKLERVNKHSGAYGDYHYTTKDFEEQVTSIDGNGYPTPLKKWIIEKSKVIANEFGTTVPTKVDTSLGYYEPKYETVKKGDAKQSSAKTTAVKANATKTSAKASVAKTSAKTSAKASVAKTSAKANVVKTSAKTSAKASVAKTSAKANVVKTSAKTSAKANVAKTSAKTSVKASVAKTSAKTSAKASVAKTIKSTVTKVIKTKASNSGVNSSTLPVSKIKCGAGIAVCAEGLCCSEFGYCGNTADHCGVGCQSKFGKCN
ncbi:hypothetical protein LY90DRAFT_708252 [Neocallimastix californiae]|jgi:hypothetical protein|uniref:Chitin-binding type-1 domain-containing protein n=1 Tax=Neocallimastix californiae TaxID=1754190 RepID=A0A1Y2A6D4_9FUNG|nr:hypothetical protein LY90DRAFT_708252 [Neocallimastix californiae]|eukprot:ORY18082.1 hypothetical protein LY90DRAFT_708252 [Neocallimastix californiae]